MAWETSRSWKILRIGKILFPSVMGQSNIGEFKCDLKQQKAVAPILIVFLVP